MGITYGALYAPHAFHSGKKIRNSAKVNACTLSNLATELTSMLIQVLESHQHDFLRSWIVRYQPQNPSRKTSWLCNLMAVHVLDLIMGGDKVDPAQVYSQARLPPVDEAF
jgi:hypothetical protein